jgi:aryl-alcohol dehydrogenase-like predicted oxidoreductase
MRTRRLGRLGPEVSVVGLGTNNFGWHIGAAESKAVIDAALDEGVTLFDTADVYGETASETFLGEALKGRRDRVSILTKFGLPIPGAPDAARGSAEYVRSAVAGSLARLQTDVIDVYMYHAPDGVTPVAETMGALAELVREGKVRHVGISNVDVPQLGEAVAAAASEGAPLVCVESRYSVARREAEDGLIPACLRHGLGFLPYWPLESGVLTGKYARGVAPPADSRFGANRERWPSDRWLTDELFERVDALERYAAERGVSLLEVAIGGLAALPGVASVIAGATRPEQVRMNVAAASWQPGADDVAALPMPAA